MKDIQILYRDEEVEIRLILDKAEWAPKKMKDFIGVLQNTMDCFRSICMTGTNEDIGGHIKNTKY